MSTNNNWYVITGGTSNGKTTLINELAKMGYATVAEPARMLIDRAVANGMSVEEFRADGNRFNSDIARFRKQLEDESDPNEITFFDRGMQDALAYINYYGYSIEPWLDELLRTSHYKKVFIVEPLHVYRDDYARTEDEEFSKRIHQLQYEAYAVYGMEPIRVPSVSPRERAEFVLQYVNE